MGFSDSDVKASTGPFFQGVTLHDPSDPEGTMVHYAHWRGGRMEESQVSAEFLQFAGRNFPVTSFGDPSSTNVNVTVTIPAGGGHDELVEALRRFLANREVLTYRDGRGRIIFGTIPSHNIEDRREGTDVTFSVTRNDYSEAV